MALPATLNLSETLDAARRFYPNWDHRLALRLFDYFSLNPRQLHKNLSKGMKSTFNMIVGLSARCALTIFDEPTVGMDAAVRKDFYRALLQDYLQHPRTIIFSSHLLKEIEDILEEVLLLREGQKRLHLPADQLREYAVGLRGEEDTSNALPPARKFTGGSSSAKTAFCSRALSTPKRSCRRPARQAWSSAVSVKISAYTSPAEQRRNR